MDRPLLRDEDAVDSFSRFVGDSEPKLRRALTAGFGAEVGREAAAEALAYAWQHWGRVSGLANPTGYLYRVGQNAARKMTRPGSFGGRPEAVVEEPWAETGFGEAWLRLSKRQRVVMGLIHGFDWTFAEVADLLGVSRGTVQSYEKRALSRLRKDLGVDE